MIFRAFVTLKLIEIQEKHIINWTKSNNLKNLHFSLSHAKFNLRLRVINALMKIKNKTSIPYLLVVAKNDYQEIAFKAIDAIKRIDIRKEYSTEINNIESFWAKKIEQKKNRVVGKKTNKTFDKNRMQALANLKQQLKRPMSGGKWF